MGVGELRITVQDRAGEAWSLQGQVGDVLMPILRDRVDLAVGICGGVMSCGTCLVRVDDDWVEHLPPPADDEIEMLDALDAVPGSRLACQLVLSDSLDGLKLTMAAET